MGIYTGNKIDFPENREEGKSFFLQNMGGQIKGKSLTITELRKIRYERIFLVVSVNVYIYVAVTKRGFLQYGSTQLIGLQDDE